MSGGARPFRICFAALLCASAGALAEPHDATSTASATTEREVLLGPSKAQASSSTPSLEWPFTARADEELTSARIRLAFAPQGDRDGRSQALEGLELLVNDERIALLGAQELKPGATREVAVPQALLADRNSLTARLVDGRGQCAARPGAWKTLTSISVLLQARAVALPNELALLPLPFYDRGVDSRAVVPVVLANATSPAKARLAALTASWFAVDAPVPLTFEAHQGALPDSRAIVLVAGEAEARALGLEPPAGPAVRLVDHPKHPESNVKLLVIEGRSDAELASAVESMAARKTALAGASVSLPKVAPAAPAAPWSAPRWVPSGRAVPFSEYPETEVLSHDGSTPATLSVRFRIAPDLMIWPAEFVVLDLGYSQRVPPGAMPPRLDVEMNGYFLATLPPLPGAGEHAGRQRLRIPREHMRGFNQLLVHVHYPEPDGCAAAAESAGKGGDTRVAIAPDSVLHIESLQHFASLPDVSLFALDGFPFSRVPDLGETAVLLPDAPEDAELSMVLSLFGQLAQVTGTTGTRATFLPASTAGADELRDKDLLVVGGAADNAAIARWQKLLPLTLSESSAQVQRPRTAGALLSLLGGVGPLLDERRAGPLLASARDAAAIVTLESPTSANREAVIVTGTSPARLPGFDQFLGYAESRGSGGDVLLVSAGHRYRFGLGSTFGRGRLDPWTRLRWFFATHWMALMPLLVVSVLLLGAQGARYLGRRMRERLALGAA